MTTVGCYVCGHEVEADPDPRRTRLPGEPDLTGGELVPICVPCFTIIQTYGPFAAPFLTMMRHDRARGCACSPAAMALPSLFGPTATLVHEQDCVIQRINHARLN